MPKVIETPTGEVEFPDTMSDAEITAVLRKQFPPAGGPKSTPPGGGAEAPVGAPGVAKGTIAPAGPAPVVAPSRLARLGNLSKPGRDTAENPPLATVAPLMVPGAGLLPAAARIGLTAGAGALDKMAGGDPTGGAMAAGGKQAALEAILGPGGRVLSRLPGVRSFFPRTKTETWSESPWAPRPPAPVPPPTASGLPEGTILGPTGRVVSTPPPAPMPPGPTKTTVTSPAGATIPPQLRQILGAFLQ